MASFNSISPEKLSRLVGTPKGPVLIDVRDEDDFTADPHLVPSSFHRPMPMRPHGRTNTRASGSSFSASTAVNSARALPHGCGLPVRLQKF